GGRGPAAVEEGRAGYVRCGRSFGGRRVAAGGAVADLLRGVGERPAGRGVAGSGRGRAGAGRRGRVGQRDPERVPTAAPAAPAAPDVGQRPGVGVVAGERGQAQRVVHSGAQAVLVVAHRAGVAHLDRTGGADHVRGDVVGVVGPERLGESLVP